LQTTTFVVLARRLKFNGDAAQKVCEELSMREGLALKNSEKVFVRFCSLLVESECLAGHGTVQLPVKKV
jgi:hypothetical protein